MATDGLTPVEAAVVVGGLSYCHGALSLAQSGLNLPEAEVDAALGYFHAADDGRPLDPRMAAAGLKAVERAMELLAGDPELGTLVGYEPELSAARAKLRQAAARLPPSPPRPGRGSG